MASHLPTMTATPSTPLARTAHLQAPPSLGWSIIGLGIGCIPLVMAGLSMQTPSDGMPELDLLRDGEVAEGVVLNRHKERRSMESRDVDIHGLKVDIHGLKVDIHEHKNQSAPRPKDKSSPTVHRKQISVDRETRASSPPRCNALSRHFPACLEPNRLDEDELLSSDLLALIIVSSLGVSLGLLAIRSPRRLYHLALLTWRGQQTVAEVVDRWKEDNGLDTSHCVLYRFATRPSPDSYHYVAEDNFRAYQYLNVNDRVKVRYVPNRPDICRLKL
jgi:hypothetical protein